ncbi:glycosyl transferase [Tistrella bauzanensis]|uniref:Glycosyl transferase n=1 Tax=Tistrella bauzanensis TaxID=657419 RepID=A0ABQ1IJ28_9PROT|nr:glycosyltransferase [Tistrella bauzanensis]GGB41486.1 glycosyl transferase [Tistrella bauzanensis]
MRVVHLITTLGRGGAETQLLMMIRHQIREQGIEVHLRVLYGSMAFEPAFREAGVASIERLSGDRLDGRVAFRRLRHELTVLKPDVLHTHLMKANAIGGLAGWRARVPAVVAHKHNDEEHMRRRPVALAHDLLSRLTDDAVVYLSDHVARFFRDKGTWPHPNGHVVPYGFEPAIYGRARDLRAELGLREDDILFGTVARIAPQKGMDVLIRAFEAVADRETRAHLAIVGGPGFDAAHVALIEGLARDSRHAGRIHLTGQIQTPMDAFAALDVFMLASRWEGFGLVLLEAMAAGCTIIATRVSAIPEVVRDGVDGQLVPAEDPAALADAMTALIAVGRPVKRPNAGRLADFSPQASFGRIRALYDSLLEPRPR